MAIAVTPCGEKLTMNELARHIMLCRRCMAWWVQRQREAGPDEEDE